MLLQDPGRVCGLSAALAVVGGKWKVLVLWEMSEGPVRFGELKRRLKGISEKMLAQTLRELEADGIVHRESFDEVPPRVEYSTTAFGASLNAALEPLCRWGEQHLDRIVGKTPAADLPRKACGLPLAGQLE